MIPQKIARQKPLPYLFLCPLVAIWLLFGARAVGFSQELPTPASFPSGMEGMEQMIAWLYQASDEERLAFTAALWPEKGDYELVFQKKYRPEAAQIPPQALA